MNDPAATQAVGRGRRTAAAGALLLGAAAPVAGAAFLLRHLLLLVVTAVAVGVAVVLTWVAVTRRGTRRLVAAAAVVLVLLGVLAGLLTALHRRGAIVGIAVLVVLVAGTALLAHVALRPEGRRLRGGPDPRRPAARTRHPVLLMNPKSGGGKVEDHDLEAECERRGIRPVVIGPGDDFRAAALAAVRAGADLLGAAGGDGTQAIVAQVAVEHDLPFVCIPAGTRNHFALDLGVDREDVVGSLDAFVDGIEQRVDLGVVNDRVFVNNVSLGVYGEIVQSEQYRDAKVRTTLERLPDLLGPDGDAPELRLPGPDGTERTTRQLVLVANNPYVLERIGGFGTRERMDTGLLGVTTLNVASTTEAAALTALSLAGQLARFDGYESWTTAEIAVDADRAIAAGIDGEFCDLEPPVRFGMLPGALRVRIARHAPGASPAATVARPDRATGRALWALARGVARSTPVTDG